MHENDIFMHENDISMHVKIQCFAPGCALHNCMHGNFIFMHEGKMFMHDTFMPRFFMHGRFCTGYLHSFNLLFVFNRFVIGAIY